MKERILKLSKRLNKFMLDEISLIAEDIEESVLIPILEELVQEQKLIKRGDLYLYNKKITANRQISKVPIFFQYYDKSTAELILKCFCAEIPVLNVALIIEPSKTAILNFYNYFRKCLYETQLNKLKKHYDKTPQIPFNKVIDDYGYPVISKDVADTIEQVRKSLAKNPNAQTVRIAKLNGTLKDKNGQPSIYDNSKWKFLLDAPFKISYKCCEIMKKRPFKEYSKQTGKRGFIATMASESRLRTSVYLKNGCNAINSSNPYSMPLGFWTEQDILQYLIEYNVPYCPIYGEIKQDKKGKYYTTGEHRTGCMFCMFGCHLEKSPNRFQRMKITHPKLYDYCINKLKCGEVLDFIGVKYD